MLVRGRCNGKNEYSGRKKARCKGTTYAREREREKEPIRGKNNADNGATRRAVEQDLLSNFLRARARERASFGAA